MCFFDWTDVPAISAARGVWKNSRWQILKLQAVVDPMTVSTLCRTLTQWRRGTTKVRRRISSGVAILTVAGIWFLIRNSGQLALVASQSDTIQLMTTTQPSTVGREQLLPVLDGEQGFQWCRPTDYESRLVIETTPNVNLKRIKKGTVEPLFTGRPSLTSEPQRWQAVTGRFISVFSAYIDERSNVDDGQGSNGPFVRVIASGLQASFNRIGDIYCQMWYKNIDRPVTFGPATYDLIYPSTLHDGMWVAHFILCRLPSNWINSEHGTPYAVSIVAGRCDTSVGNQLLVLHRERHQSRDRRTDDVIRPSFALCLPVLYGRKVSWQMLIEWIELHALLGVSEVFVYHKDTTPEVNRVFESYQQNRSDSVRLTVIPWRFPSDRLIDYFCQHEAINECVYRAASRHHRYAAVCDIDEILVPRQTGSHPTSSPWADFVANYGSDDGKAGSDDVGAFLFQHSYFRRNVTSNKSRPPLVSMQSFWRTAEVTPPGKIRSKTLYDVEKVVKVNIHSPYTLVHGAVESVVDPQKGMLHHYRSDPMETFRNHPERFQFVEDKYMMKFSDELTSAVSERIKLVGL